MARQLGDPITRNEDGSYGQGTWEHTVVIRLGSDCDHEPQKQEVTVWLRKPSPFTARRITTLAAIRGDFGRLPMEVVSSDVTSLMGAKR